MRSMAFIFGVLLSSGIMAGDAHFYMGMGYDLGGDKLAEADNDEDLRAGQGLVLAVGMDYDVANDFMLRGTLGYKLDAVEADNGEVDLRRTQIELLGYHFFKGGYHGLGAGLTLHRNIKFGCDVDFICSGTEKADDANGLVIEDLYRTKNDGSSGATIGARLGAGLEYDFGGDEKVDANYFGVNIGLSL